MVAKNEATVKVKKSLSQKIATVAGDAISKQGYVSAIDLFLGIGWLNQDNLLDWKKGKIPYLERVVTASLGKISRAMKELRFWANHAKLKESMTVYQHKSYKLRFSKSGNPTIETAYSTHFVLVTSNKNDNPKDDPRTRDIEGLDKIKRIEK